MVDLIDARNQAFTAEQTTASSEYEFLINLVDLQRALSWFAAEQTNEQQDAFVEGARQAISNESAR